MALAYSAFNFEHFEEEPGNPPDPNEINAEVNNVGVEPASENAPENLPLNLQGNNLGNNNLGNNNLGGNNLGNNAGGNVVIGGGNMPPIDIPDNNVGSSVEEEELDLEDEESDMDDEDEEIDYVEPLETTFAPETTMKPGTTVSILPGVPTPNVPPHTVMNSLRNLLSLNNVLIFILILLVLALALTLKK